MNWAVPVAVAKNVEEILRDLLMGNFHQHTKALRKLLSPESSGCISLVGCTSGSFRRSAVVKAMGVLDGQSASTLVEAICMDTPDGLGLTFRTFQVFLVIEACGVLSCPRVVAFPLLCLKMLSDLPSRETTS
ncbi:hypothetical protein V7S43_015740 [Phytophthora oleae]|uniref:Uncharacterized protein n=1 Tax=Phytophthora oleae TaxID=2107226 RepID=A0ABD3EX88_9STRA